MVDWLDERLDDRYRYDTVIGGIPVVFGLTYLVGVSTVLGDLLALFLASIASSLLMVEALFLNPP